MLTRNIESEKSILIDDLKKYINLSTLLEHEEITNEQIIEILSSQQKRS